MRSRAAHYGCTRDPSPGLKTAGASGRRIEEEVTEAKTLPSLAGRAIGRGLSRGLVGRNVDHFSRSSVMELLAGFFLDSFGIRLELVDFAGVLLVFFLQLLDVLLHALVFCFLSAIDDHTVCAKSHVHKQPDRQNSDRHSCNPAPQFIQFREIRFKCCLNSARPSFCLIRSMGERTQPLLWRRNNADSGNAYSKIHCLAAALSFERAGSLLASE